MPVNDDADVIARSLVEPERFALIFDRHFDRLLGYLSRRVGRELAAELAADTFERAFRSRARFVDAGGSALPWLYGIAANVLRMHRRTEQRRLRAFAREARLQQPEQVDGHGEGALDPALLEALAALSQPLREVLLLHAWGELAGDEIAVALGLSPAAVRTRLHRARAQVTRRLDAAEAENELAKETAR